MILTFSEPKFEDLLIRNVKGTTFRVDKGNRWKVGMTANLWMHNPRNVCMNPHRIKNDRIHYIEHVLFIPIKGVLIIYNDETRKDILVSISEKKRLHSLNRIARTDGFTDFAEMKQWFLQRGYTDPKGYQMKRLFFDGYFDDLLF